MLVVRSPNLDDERVQALARRIFFARFSERCIALGLDLDDVMQTVFLGLLVRAESLRSHWDPARGALSTWMYVAIGGIVVNVADRERRGRKRWGSVGARWDAAIDYDGEIAESARKRVSG